jgi:glycosyltransferase involved in cell wall biosynthesis
MSNFQMKDLLFSIIIPLYNKEGYVGDTLDSVLRQEYDNYEVLVVDDGSTDGSAALVASYAERDPRIRLITQENGGVSVARNRGMAEAAAPYYAFLDADDTWAPEHLSEIAALVAAYPEAALLGTAYQRCFNSGPSASLVLTHLEAQHGLVDDYFKYVAQAQFIYTSSIAVAAWAIDEVGGFPEGVRNGEDLDLWTRLALKWPVAYSGKVTVNYACGVVGQATSCSDFSPHYPKTLAESFVGESMNAFRKKNIDKIAKCLLLNVTGRFFSEKVFRDEAWRDYLRESKYFTYGKSGTLRLLYRFPLPWLWCGYFYCRRILTSRKWISICGGVSRRGDVTYKLSS